MKKEAKRKINCLVCNATYMNNNSNDPYDAIYLGFLEGQKRGADKPAFIHNNVRCIKKAKKIRALDKSGKFVYCIKCGHRVNLSQKNLDGGGTIKQNGYLVDNNAWIHTPFPLKEKHSDLVISDCYELAFGHSNCPPNDILSKRESILNKFNYKKKKSESDEQITKKEKINTDSDEVIKRKILTIKYKLSYLRQLKVNNLPDSIDEVNQNNIDKYEWIITYKLSDVWKYERLLPTPGEDNKPKYKNPNTVIAGLVNKEIEEDKKQKKEAEEWEKLPIEEKEKILSEQEHRREILETRKEMHDMYDNKIKGYQQLIIFIIISAVCLVGAYLSNN